MDEMEALYALQQVDQELSVVRSDSVESKEHRMLVRTERRLSEKVQLRQTVRDEIVDYEKNQRRLELDLATVEGEIAKIDHKLFGGDLKNAKEMASFQERLDLQKRRKDEFEEKILAAMEDVETCRARLRQLDQECTKAESDVSAARSALDESQAQRMDDVKRLEAMREDAREASPAQLLARYDQLFERLGGHPVAKVEERTCTGCHVGLPTGARPPKDGETLRCPHCGRLLWWPQA